MPHTPGPWIFDDERKHYNCPVIRYNGCIIAKFTDVGDLQGKAEYTANANHIIQCVNEREILLATIHVLINNAGTPAMKRAIVAARSILAKAEGN